MSKKNKKKKPYNFVIMTPRQAKIQAILESIDQKEDFWKNILYKRVWDEVGCYKYIYVDYKRMAMETVADHLIPAICKMADEIVIDDDTLGDGGKGFFIFHSAFANEKLPKGW